MFTYYDFRTVLSCDGDMVLVEANAQRLEKDDTPLDCHPLFFLPKATLGATLGATLCILFKSTCTILHIICTHGLANKSQFGTVSTEQTDQNLTNSLDWLTRV